MATKLLQVELHDHNNYLSSKNSEMVWKSILKQVWKEKIQNSLKSFFFLILYF